MIGRVRDVVIECSEPFVLVLSHEVVGDKLLRVEPGRTCCASGVLQRMRRRNQLRLSQLWARAGWWIVEWYRAEPEPAGVCFGGDVIEDLHVACASEHVSLFEQLELSGFQPGDLPSMDTVRRQRRRLASEELR